MNVAVQTGDTATVSLEWRGGGERRGWCWRRSLEEEEASAESVLRRAAASCCQLPNMVQEDGTLQGVELRGVSRDLGEERIRHKDSRLVTMAGIGIAKQGRDVNLQSFRQTIQGGEGRHCLAVLDLGDVGAGDVHACSELTLRQVAYVAQVANRGCYLKTTLLLGLGWDEGERCWCKFRLVNLEGLAASPAECVGGAELYQAAIVTTQNLTLFDGRHHGCHKLCVTEGPRARTHHTSDNGTM